MDEWYIYKMYCMCTMENYAALKWKEMLSYATAWMKFEGLYTK